MESIVNLEACLPAELRGPTTTITRIAAGLSGAGVHRVEVDGRAFVLKISPADEHIADFSRKCHILGLAANAGLAPAVVHVDEAQRAVVSAFVVDRSFPALYTDPRTREAALAQLGRTLRGVHELPLPPGATGHDRADLLAAIWSQLGGASFALPASVGDAIQRVLTEQAPPRERALVLSHNDVNPTNLIHDGERLMLIDWEFAGPDDAFYDLAAVAVFFCMDDATCRSLLAAHDSEPVPTLPARFTYCRRLVAALCGAVFLRMAHHGGHAGATGAETFDRAPSLGELYPRLQSGTLDPATPEGQWDFGLALVKASAAL
jgi:aminoglycoside phosphotransferase (APT) family kinase protein